MNDPNNIYLWKLSDGSQVLGQILNLVPGIKSQKAVHQALNGETYVQQVGMGIQKAALTIYVDSQEALLNVDKSNADCKFLHAYYQGVSYFGIIEDEAISWETVRPGSDYTATINFQVSHRIKDSAV